MSSNTPTYLPRMRTRIGKAGYKGKDVIVVDGPVPEAAAGVVTAPKAPTKSVAKATPASGIKALKGSAKK
jgi:hypothetical protein